MIPKKHACLDIPSPQDYHYTEVFGVAEVPRVVLYNRTTVYNQGEKHTPDTTYACTCYSATHGVNEGNALEALKFAGEVKEVDPVGIWQKALDRGAEIKKGWSLQGATNIMKDLGCITGYTLCRSLGEVKQALARGQVLQTGSRSIDWVKTRANKNIVVKGDSYGHAFLCVGYDDDKELLTMKNSYGPNKYDKGLFYTKYSDFALLYSCLAYADNATPEIRNYQAKKRRALAVERGIYNGKEDDLLLIRQDASVMAMRTGGLKSDTGIWNKKNKMVQVFRVEFQAMLERATGRKIQFDIGDQKGFITRGEAAEWCVRI